MSDFKWCIEQQREQSGHNGILPGRHHPYTHLDWSLEMAHATPLSKRVYRVMLLRLLYTNTNTKPHVADLINRMRGALKNSRVRAFEPLSTWKFTWKSRIESPIASVLRCATKAA